VFHKSSCFTNTKLVGKIYLHKNLKCAISSWIEVVCYKLIKKVDFVKQTQFPNIAFRSSYGMLNGHQKILLVSSRRFFFPLADATCFSILFHLSFSFLLIKFIYFLHAPLKKGKHEKKKCKTKLIWIFVFNFYSFYLPFSSLHKREVFLRPG